MNARRRTVLRGGHAVELLQGWKNLFPAMQEAISQAVHEVRIETYIFSHDSAGETMVATLAEAALRGVNVYLVMDGIGTSQLPKAWVQQLDQAGVQWHIFNQTGLFGLLQPSRWRRLHRKLCLVDGWMLFCGGINVMDDWHDPNHGDLTAPRFDFSVRVTGPLVSRMHETMTRFWWRLQAASDVREADWPAAWHALEASVRQAREARQHTSASPITLGADPGARASLLLRDNVRHRRDIERAYRQAIALAREEIIIANAYFLPGRGLRQDLIHAAKRGVRVRLLLQGRYEYFMQFHATRPVYGSLLGAGVEIFEYSPSFLHAKVAVIDSHWATVGSSNLDPLSLLLAREANVVIDDPKFALELRERLVHAMDKEGQRVDPLSCTRRPWHQRLLDRIAFGLLRAALFVTGFRY